ncbi:chemotaxis protein CheW [Sulfurifustis variabilis]|uniref:Chemotaxis protein CheW n=1 Tax=Sulfurifustis variabilis TaxID=1675686 RepID=A0A1C7AFE5_9GAMM|nr:chemotaxis protein CheW [Sulfurifustis variabilis]BAU50026.1 chemotaxis protein CheW [Sulfurifustis variabilis]
MKPIRVHERIHSLEIPLGGFSLLLPSAAIAEVTSYIALDPVPGGASWVLGVFGWRSHAVPVVSFEALLGRPAGAVSASSKLVVFYPLAGRRAWEFFALLSATEPRPRAIDTETAVPAGPAELPDTHYIAAGLRTENGVLAIPDLDAIKALFYPQAAH